MTKSSLCQTFLDELDAVKSAALFYDLEVVVNRRASKRLVIQVMFNHQSQNVLEWWPSIGSCNCGVREHGVCHDISDVIELAGCLVPV